MNDELKTKEYLQSLENITLADSSRQRIRAELQTHVRFHSKHVSDIPIKSPFNWLLLRTSQVAFAIVLVCGVGAAFYLTGTDKQSGQLAMDETVTSSDTTQASSTVEAPKTENPDVLAVAPVSSGDSLFEVQPESADPATARLMAKESADTASDEAMMSTMVSQGEMNIDDYRADVILREQAYRSLIKKYEIEIGAKTTAELTQKLNTIATLLKNAEGKEEAESRALLDKAMIAAGEIESALSLLGTVTVENGVIVAIEFAAEAQ